MSRPVFWPADVHLLDTRTGERVVYRSEREEDDPYAPGMFADFIWQEGNYSCDCNRALFFARAKGQSPAIMEQQCSDGRYVVEKIVRLSDGAVVYSELQRAARPHQEEDGR